MSETPSKRQRRTFRWSPAARQLVRKYQEHSDFEPVEMKRRVLVTRLVEISGNPRQACLRFLCQLGITEKRRYRAWSKPEQQRLLQLITSMPVEEAAKLLRRPAASVRSMLHRLGLGGRQARDWFTKFSLAQALHVRCDAVQKWIDRGWLKARVFETRALKVRIIDADDFCDFVEQHGRELVGNHLNEERLRFVCNYVFPPRHNDLLDVRGTYKKRTPDEPCINHAGGSAEAAEKDEDALGQAA